MTQLPNYFAYLGKSAQAAADAAPGHPAHRLIYHCMDAAACAYWMARRDAFNLQSSAASLGLTTEAFSRFLAWGTMIHDAGKFADAFQRRLRQPQDTPSFCPRHDALGREMWKRLFKQHDLAALSPIFAQRASTQFWFQQVLPAFLAHHGMPELPAGSSNDFNQEDLQALAAWMHKAVILTQVDLPLINESLLRHRAELPWCSWNIAGAVVLADWLASDAGRFAYCDDVQEESAYWETTLAKAEKLVPFRAPLLPEPFTNVSALFPYVKTATPLQAEAARIPIKSNEPKLFICEDATGAGKTEAALTLASRLMNAGCGSRLYFALPTMATSNAMYERALLASKRIFSSGIHEPTLVLAHGQRNANKAFLKTLTEIDDHSDTDGELLRWISQRSKLALLADFGVGTVDQALMAVLAVRHQDLRCLGLHRTILIVDEVHAYDPYVNALLCELLRRQAADGSSVILLSATLNSKLRRMFLRAFASGCSAEALLPEPDDQMLPFPLLTEFCKSNGLQTHVVAPRQSSVRSVRISWISDEHACIEKLIRAAQSGKCAVWIRNSVKEAIAAFEAIKKQDDRIKAIVFHSRFTLTDRMRIEASLLNNFGKQSRAQQRAGQIVIATQVIEQSLDLDFDEMISDLAPIDLLIQRLGRLRRHYRDNNGDLSDREERGEPCLHVHAPNETDPEQWLAALKEMRGTALVYQNHALLWLTEEALMARQHITVPDDMRSLIETVYCGEDRLPACLIASWQKSENAAFEMREKVGLVSLDMSKGYVSDQLNAWLSDQEVTTRLGGFTKTLPLARLTADSMLRPYHDQGWAMSLLPVPIHWLRQASETNLYQIPKNDNRIIQIKGIPAKAKELIIADDNIYSSECGFIGDA